MTSHEELARNILRSAKWHRERCDCACNVSLWELQDAAKILLDLGNFSIEKKREIFLDEGFRYD